ncbi:unnamed protein product [marine sediment metagenome]|uniref:Uncharacterized protein n=1 Tax=marine sediment metagenome TaxID=412755 RepID=X1FVX9_9ZZZZ
MKSDLQIAQEAKLKSITEIAASIGIKEDELKNLMSAQEYSEYRKE